MFLNWNSAKLNDFMRWLTLNRAGGRKMTRLPQFYQQMIALWEKTSDKEPNQVLEIFNQLIWNNRYILKQDKGLFYPYLC